LLLDVTPLSLGLETVGGVMTKIIERNTTIPCKKTESFTTETDNQTTIKIDIYEGERYKTKDNNLLGTFDLDGIAPAPRGVPQVEITYELDANGILNVNTRDRATSKVNSITISNDKGRLTQADIDRMIEEAEKFKSQDDAQAAKVAAREEVKNYIYQVMDSLENATMVEKVTSEELEKVEEGCQDALEWLEQNESAEKEQLDAKKRQLETVIKPVMMKMYAEKSKKSAGNAGKKKSRR
jgi:L1 cell adhesion molecule like protein